MLAILGIPSVVLLAVAVLLVGWEVIQRHFVPEPSVALNHFLITVRALTITVAGCGIVYWWMRRQHRRVTRTAERLADFLVAYMADPSTSMVLDNRSLRHCRDVLGCQNSQCTMYDRPGERCWQVMALSRSRKDRLSPGMEIEKCRECDVFRLSTPDEFSALGEDIDNLVFLLREGARETERMRADLVEREKMFSIGQLASGIAHEVGNPLSSISSIVQVLKRSGVNGGMSEQLDVMETHIQRITSTVRQLSRLSRQGGEPWADVDIGQALCDTVRLVRFDDRARGVDIVCPSSFSLPRTKGIPGQIEQVFLNLMLNALDAMPGGGTLRVAAHAARGRIAVLVKDTGCGIPAEVGPHVFNPFFTTKDPGRGTGLGLAVSYTIVQKLGGTISFESAEGRGTTFTVELPVLDQAPLATH